MWVFLREKILPSGRSALLAAGVGLTWAAAMHWLVWYGWYPGVGLFSYRSLGIVVTLVLLTRDRFPRLTLLAVALFYPDGYGDWLSTYWHVLPYALAG